MVFLAGGTLAAVMLVAMVVALTPRPGSGPEAISATTRPASAETRRPPETAGLQLISAARAPRLASFAPIPNAVSASPVTGTGTLTVARSVPDGDDVVHVNTELVTYRVTWDDLAFLVLVEPATVLNARGELVAHIVGGEIDVVVD